MYTTSVLYEFAFAISTPPDSSSMHARQVFVAVNDDLYRKPYVGSWNLLCSSFNGGIKPDLERCSYVGDAGGRVKGYGESKASHRDYSGELRIVYHCQKWNCKRLKHFLTNEKNI